jgi:hypothetical protein
MYSSAPASIAALGIVRAAAAVSMSTRVAVSPGFAADRAADFEATAPGQHEVEQHEMRLEVAERGERGLAVARDPGFESGIAHEELQGSDDALLVLGDQDARGHAVVYLALLQ